MNENDQSICMKFLNTPLDDYLSILKYAGYVNTEMTDGRKLKIALIGTCSIQYVALVLKAMLACNGISAELYEGQYNGIITEVFDEGSGMYSFVPDIVILIPDYRDIKGIPDIFDDLCTVEKRAAESARDLMEAAQKIHEKLGNAHVLYCNMAVPYISSLGNLSVNCVFSEIGFLDRVNLLLTSIRPDYVTIVDMDGLSREVGKREWFDDSAYYLSKLGFSLKYIGHFCRLVWKQIMAVQGIMKKCLVLDLDHTLWGGAVGDEGPDGINLDPNDPEGEAYIAFQEFIISLKRRGVILAVCSKNDEDIAKEVFARNPYMKLHLNDISCFICNWEDKASNIRRIAKNLNIGIDSMVFFDDNPTERELVRSMLPEVEVIEASEDPVYYIRDLYDAHAFEWTGITVEDLGRTETYVSELKRDSLRLISGSYEHFLQSLHMKADFSEVTEITVKRFAQLMNKTNQFNLMTNRYSETAIMSMYREDKYKLYTVQMADKFSNYGIIACIVLLMKDDVCEISDWCMSCRVLKKGVELFTIKKIAEVAVRFGCHRIMGHYRTSGRNGMVSSLFDALGFELLEEMDGRKEYVLELTDMDQRKWKNEIKECML